MRVEHETFQNHILRLTEQLIEQQGIRGVRLDGGRDRTSSVGE